MLIADFDDFSEDKNLLNLFYKIHDINPLFKCTLFVIPGLCSEKFLQSIPPWLEIAVHGWKHEIKSAPNNECLNWKRDDMKELLSQPILKYFVKGFKAPWYRLSKEGYDILFENNYWVMEKPGEKVEKNKDIIIYKHIDAPIFWHGHIGNNPDDGLSTFFNEFIERVKEEKYFYTISEFLKRKFCLNVGAGIEPERNNNEKIWVNNDIRNFKWIDIISDCGNLPFLEDTFNEIKAVHLLEHFSLVTATSLLSYWFSLLKKGGKFIIEVPNFDLAIKDYLNGNDKRLINIFGLHRFKGDDHFYGWNERRLLFALEKTGFTKCEIKVDYSIHSKDEPCIKIEAIK